MKNYYSKNNETEDYGKSGYSDINGLTEDGYPGYDNIESFSEDYKDRSSDFKLNKKDIKELKKRDRKISKQPRKFFRGIWLAMIAIIVVAISEMFFFGIRDMLALDRKNDSTVNISIPQGCSISQVANILKSSNVINDPTFFTSYLSFSKKSHRFTQGVYDIPLNMEYTTLITYLQDQSNRLDVSVVTFHEGMNVLECANLLQEKGICNKEKFLEECKSSDFDKAYPFLTEIPNAGERYYKLEGYLYPDTYNLYPDSDPKDVIKKFLKNYQNKINEPHAVTGYNENISVYDIAKQGGYSMDDVIKLASIVQAEAANVEDMKIIAGIFKNRINAGAKQGFQHLGSDATVYYPYRTKQEAPEGYESKYNTYKVEGLPQGPICNPSMDAIMAAINSTKTDYMYFAHDKNGKAYYAKDEAGQNANLKKIQSANGAS